MVEVLAKSHDRKGFHCGVEPLDRYFREQAGQESRKRVAAPFVLWDREQERIAGYYTLSMTSILTQGLPAEFKQKLPRYDAMPAVLLGRLAVDSHYQGQGLGAYLLVNALRRAFDNPIAAAFVVVDAFNDTAKDFYQAYGFLHLPDYERRLFIPMATLEPLFTEKGNV